MTRLVLSSILAIAVAGCIRAPAVVIIDRKTALEQLAAGSYRQLEDALDEVAVTPRPEALTRAELEKGGATEGLATEAGDRTEAAAVDELLRRRCLGEALDGTLVVTASGCAGRGDPAERSRLAERVNRDRFEIWRELQTRGLPKGKERDLELVRRAWRAAHLRAIVCGGQVQRADGTWEDKKC